MFLRFFFFFAFIFFFVGRAFGVYMWKKKKGLDFHEGQ